MNTTKKTYTSPAITDLGTVETLTMGTGANNSDNGQAENNSGSKS